MTATKILTALGELTKRTLRLVFKLCGMFLTLLLQAFFTGITKPSASDKQRAQAENHEYYARAAANNYDDW